MKYGVKITVAIKIKPGNKTYVKDFDTEKERDAYYEGLNFVLFNNEEILVIAKII
jgi:hypothetical protein